MTHARGARHRLRPLAPRDPHEPHRVSSPLELLFDLTFAVAFGLSGAQFAHYLSQGHLVTALVGFVFAGFGIVWAWINYSWFASAYAHDDWGFRLLSMAVMVGVVVLALGIAPMYASIESDHFDNLTIISGYVVMRLALLVGWVRAWRADPARRPAIKHYVGSLAVAQILWLALGVAPASVAQTLGAACVLVVIEVLGPVLAERRTPTPWHAHHKAERYSLLVIITLGEGVIGTVAALSSVVGRDAWGPASVMVVVAGIGLTFALWWTYFSLDAAPILHAYRPRSFAFGYLHLPLFWAVAATGAGLHVAAAWAAGTSALPLPGVVAAVAVPVLVFEVVVYGLYYVLHRGAAGSDVAFHVGLFAGTCLVLAASVALAFAGAPLGVCLLAVVAGPAVSVVGYELVGHRHMDADRDALLRAAEH